MALLSEDELEEYLAEMPGWELVGKAIEREFEFEDFVGSVRFVDALVAPAEAMNHHPDLAISWNKVTVTITNHAEGGVTMKDLDLAEQVSEVAENH